MIPPHLFYQIYISFLEQNDCTPPKCGELSEYTDSAHTEVEDLSSKRGITKSFNFPIPSYESYSHLYKFLYSIINNKHLSYIKLNIMYNIYI